jgi:hypothetical protein
MLIPNISNLGIGYGGRTWFKLLPRFIFFIAMIETFSRSIESRKNITKVIVSFAVVTVFLHLILIIRPNISYINIGGLSFAGPYGLLGNVNSRLFLPGLDQPIYRLTGFFNEPSNASAFLFASYFLSKSIIDGERLWGAFSKVCLLGGFMCFSNAGYLAVGAAATISIFVDKLENQNRFKSIMRTAVIITWGLGLILFGLFGRHLVYQSDTENKFLRISTGASKGSYYTNPSLEFSAGRIDLAKTTLNTINKAPLGVGFDSDERAPAGAPLLWLLYGGIPAVVLLLLREFQWVRLWLQKRKDSKILLYHTQALIVIVVQQSVYGQWNNSFYYLLVAMVMSLGYEKPPVFEVPHPRKRVTKDDINLGRNYINE